MSLSRREQSILDDGLLASDGRFCQHLCLVPLPEDDGPHAQRESQANAPGAAAGDGLPDESDDAVVPPLPPVPGPGPDNAVESRRLWPALRFETFADLIVHAGSMPNAPPAAAANLKGKLTVQYQRLRRSPSGRRLGPSDHGVGYLLYRGVAGGAVVIVPKNDSGDDGPATYDFFAHCLDMEYPGGDCPHVASERFQDAFQRVSRRLEESFEDGAAGGGDGAPSGTARTPAREAVVTTVTSGRKAFDSTVGTAAGAVCAADGDRKPAAAEEEAPAGETGTRADGDRKPAAAAEAAPAREATPDDADDGGKKPSLPTPKGPVAGMEAGKEAARIAPSTVTKKKKPAAAAAAAARGSPSGSPEGPVRSVVFSDVEKNTVSSPFSSLTCDKPDGPVEPVGPAEPLVLPWKDMHARMKSQGWTHEKGGGRGTMFSSWIYIHPSCRGMKKAELVEKTEKNVHWFEDDAIKRYARRELGWVDAEGRGGYVSGGTPTSEPGGENAAERIKTRAGRGRAARAARTSSLAVDEVANEARAARAASRSKGAGRDGPSSSAAGRRKEPPNNGAGKNGTKRKADYARANNRGRVSISPQTDEKAAARKKKKKAEGKPAPKKAGEDPPARKAGRTKKPAAAARRPPSTPAPASAPPAPAGDDPSSFSAESPAARTRGSERAEFESLRAAAAAQSSPSDSSASTASVDECYRVLPSRDGWTRLMSYYGFTYCGGKYCYPGNENRPGKGSTAQEGVHYFGSIEGVRRHLCAYGLPGEVMMVGRDVRDELNRWIRYANVRNLDDGAMINPRDVDTIDWKEAWTLLQRCGARWSGGYTYRRRRSKDWPHLPEEFKFENNNDMHTHFARFGVPNELEGQGMDRLTRMSLDLYIVGDYDGDQRQVDTFKRIEPGNENLNEITPGRVRRARSGHNADGGRNAGAGRGRRGASSPAGGPRGFPPGGRATGRGGNFARAVSGLSALNEIPARVIGPDEATGLLQQGYGVTRTERDGREFLCMPGAALPGGDGARPGVDYFESAQDLRENLCAYGLPRRSNRSRISKAKESALEAWVRTAHMGSSTIPQETVKPSKLKSVLRGLGYTVSSSHVVFVLPGSVMHMSAASKDRFDGPMELAVHVARFGLDTSANNGEVPEGDVLQAHAFLARVAEHKVCTRAECTEPLKKRVAAKPRVSASSDSDREKLEGAANPASSKPAPEEGEGADAAAGEPQPSLVVDDGDHDNDDSHGPSPAKKSKTAVMTDFFVKVGDRVGAAVSKFSPGTLMDGGGKPAAKQEAETAAKSNASATSSPSDMSPSCMYKKGDPEVEACLAGDGSPENAGGLPLTQAEAESHEHDGACDDTAPSLGSKPPADRPLPVEHQPLADPPDISWRGMQLSMTKSGWKIRNGTDLFAFMYINPCAAHLSKKDVLKLCKEGVHYFTDEKHVKRYAARHLGWTGEKVVSTPTSDRAASRERSDCAMAPSAAVRVQPARGGSKRGRDGRDESSSRKPPAKRRASARRPKSDMADRNRSASSQSSACASVGSDSGGSLHSVLVGEASVRDKLDFCQMSLHPSYKKSLLTKSAALSNLSQNEDRIMEFMSSSIRTEVQSPGFLYIFGGPGTGKTTAVTGCVTEAKKWAGDNNYDTPHICFVNVGSLMTSSGNGLHEAMLNKIVASLEIDQKANQKMVEKQLHRKTLILVLDEIDMMFKKSHGARSWFSTLISWADDKKMRFSMIGISNCVNDDNANLVRELAGLSNDLHSPQEHRELAFSAYTEEDILAILQARVGTRIIDLKALQLISRRVAASSGDVRRALEIVSNAINKCADLLSEEKLSRVIGDDDECLPLVKLPHMMRAIREGMPMRHADVISGLPQAAKVVLCIAASLSKAWGEGAVIGISTLKKYCVEATHHSIMDEVSIGHVQNLVEMLTDAGLLVAASSGQYDQFDSNAKLRLGVQMDDVEIALEQSLLSQEGFYRSLYNFVQKEYPDGPR